MNLLVTGGTGFIGSALCERLLDDGHAVTVLSRDADRARRHFRGRVRAIDSLGALDAGSAPEAIVNLAGENLAAHRWNAHWKRVFRDSRVRTTEQLVDYIRQAPRRPQVLVSGSAVGYYGARGDELLDENSPPGDEYQSELCAAWEAAAEEAEALGVRVCRLRTGIVLGRNGGALKSMRLPFALGLGGQLGDGRQWMSWIQLDDLVGIILYLLQHATLTGAFNGTAPEPATNAAFVRALAAALRRPAFLHMPAPIVRLLVGEMAHLLLTGQRVLPVRTQAAGYVFRYPRLPEALTACLT
ncbi:MAG TPA: TIGR01777 family oxidoreductase [Nevskiales bacterium]|nr:TIGR01777 family oxidoreductase [Nevskiales bacterium]